MWGWEGSGDVNLNPEFFNYPSLTFYAHFLAQGLLYLILKLLGEIQSAADWLLLYLTDPTPMYLAGRLVSAAFAVGTVALSYRLGRLLSGPAGALLAALCLATSGFHIARSQMIEVDVPLTFFVLLGLLGAARTAAHARGRDYLLAGLAVGLATSTKYTGALLAVPFAVAHAVALLRPGASRAACWRRAAGAIAVAALAFALTSPYVLIDWRGSHADLALEREHMEAGHFGQSAGAAWGYYAREFVGDSPGVPFALAALAGIALVAVKARNTAAIVSAAFLFAYLCVVGAWSMKADRYLLPVLPPAFVLAGAGVEAGVKLLAARGRAWRAGAAVLCAGLLLGWNVRYLPGRIGASQYDARTEAQNWIEAHVAEGSLIVSEHYGPQLFGTADLLQLAPRTRAQVLALRRGRPVFATLSLPMFQTVPERSARFYSLDLYANADYFLTSGAVRGRYEREPARFVAQRAFYQALESECRVVKRFPADGMGARLVLYERTPPGLPFALRGEVAPPRPVAADFEHGTGAEAGFYFAMGTNFEYYGRFAEALASYQMALGYGTNQRGLFMHCAHGQTRSLVALGRTAEAIEFLRGLSVRTDDERSRGLFDRMRANLERSAAKGQTP
jgi:hypothetical protein